MNYPTRSLWYTDDTQMMIGVAETLIDHQQITESALVNAFVANYVPSRGYGRGARAILEAMEEGRDYHYVANHIFPGGSYGNEAIPSQLLDKLEESPKGKSYLFELAEQLYHLYVSFSSN